MVDLVKSSNQASSAGRYQYLKDFIMIEFSNYCKEYCAECYIVLKRSPEINGMDLVFT